MPKSPMKEFFVHHGHIANSQNDQLPVRLIAQLVELCTGIADVVGLKPVEACIFLCFLLQLLKLRTNCADLSSIY